jgi:hypothetical protein
VIDLSVREILGGTTRQKEQVIGKPVFHLDHLDFDFGFLSVTDSSVTHTVIFSGATEFDVYERRVWKHVNFFTKHFSLRVKTTNRSPVFSLSFSTLL